MAYSLMKDPSVQIDLMVQEKYWPRLAGIIERTDCNYASETKTKKIKGKSYVVIHDIQSKRGNQAGEALALFFGMEWYYLMEKNEPDAPGDKFYILVKPRKKGKKNVQKDRKETGSGSKGRNTGKSGSVQSGETVESGGVWVSDNIPRTYDIREQQGRYEEAHGDFDGDK